MRYILISLLLVIGCSDNKLTGVCPEKCWTGQGVSVANSGNWKEHRIAIYPNPGRGQCRYGKPICDDTGNIIECANQVLPSTEVCDGIDNDCNDMIDERNSDGESMTRNGYQARRTEEEFNCLTSGVCWNSYQTCINGIWTCTYYSGYGPEICDGKDNDCNGMIDDGMYVGEFCYEYDDGTGFPYSAYNPCRPGTYMCVHGERKCVGAVYPEEEICDTLDNNCDGVPDNTDEIWDEEWDIVYMIDTSGSMQEEISAVKGATATYSFAFSQAPNMLFAILELNPPAIYVNFTVFSQAAAALSTVSHYGSGDERVIDALILACQEAQPNIFELNWRETSNKAIYVFTDEPPQDSHVPEHFLWHASQACAQRGVRVFVWSLNVPEFQEICDSTNGQCFVLKNTWEPLYDDMNSVVQQLCVD